MRAVADRRGALLELSSGPSVGVTAAIERPMSPPVPISEVTEAISRCSSDSPLRYASKPGAPSR